jgi:hypothetical protein
MSCLISYDQQRGPVENKYTVRNVMPHDVFSFGRNGLFLAGSGALPKAACGY